MSEQPWSREHPKVGVLGLDDWLLVQSSSRTRDTGIVTLRQLREGGARSIVPTRVVDDDFEVGELSDEEMFGGVIFVTAEAVGTIPALPAGASFTVVTIGSVAITLQPDAETVIYLDGVALDAGDTIDNTSNAGDAVTFVAMGPGEIYASSGMNWVDGGQPA